MSAPQVVLTRYLVDISQAKEGLNDYVKANQQAEEAGVDAAQKVGDAEKKLGDTTVQAGKRMRDEKGRFIKQNKDAEASVKQLGNTSNQVYKGLVNSLKDLAKGAAAAFTVREVIRFGAAVIKLGEDVNQAFTRIDTLVGVTGPALDELRVGVEDVSKLTGQSQLSLAEGTFAITSAGLRGQKALETLEQSAKAAANGLGETKQIALASAAATTAYADENLSAAESIDILAATVKEGNLEASSLAPTLGGVVGIAAELEVSFAEVGANIATYTKLGKGAAEATTSLVQVLNAFIKPTAEGEKQLAKLGTTSEQLREKLGKDGLRATLDFLVQGFDGNVEALGAFFGSTEALANVLGTASAQGEAYKVTLDNIKNSTGLVNEGFETTSKTLTGQFNIAIANVQAELIKLGQSAEGPLAKITGDFNKLFAQITGAEERTGRIGKIAELLILGFDKLQQSIRNLTAPFEALFIIIGKIATNLGLVSEETKGVDVALKIVERALNQVGKPLQFVADLILNLAGVWNGLIDAFRVGADSLTTVFNGLGNAIDLATQGKFKQASDALKGFDFKGVGEAFNKGFADIVALNDPRVKEAANKTGEQIVQDVAQPIADTGGAALATALATAITDPKVQEAINAAILELEKQIQRNEFRIKFGIDPEGADLADDTPDQVAPIKAQGEALDELEKKIVKVGKERERQSQVLLTNIAAEDAAERQRLQNQIDGLRAVGDIVANLASLAGDSERAQIIASVAQIGVNTALSLSNQAVAISEAIKQGSKFTFPANLAAILTAVSTVIAAFAQVKALNREAQAAVPSFDVGTESAPGGLAKVHKDELIDLPKGSVVYTAEASKKRKPLIEAINRGVVDEYIQRVYVEPALMNQRKPKDEAGGTMETYDDYNLRQAIKNNKEVELGPRTRKLFKTPQKTFH